MCKFASWHQKQLLLVKEHIYSIYYQQMGSSQVQTDLADMLQCLR